MKKVTVEDQFTEEEAAAKLRVSTKTMLRRRQARPAVFKPAPWLDNGVWKYSASTLNNYIESRRVAA